MTEFVAPYSKQHLFMVLHKYNPDPEPILATAQVIRDSSFFPASTNTYVAAVSLRLSMFGNPESGYVYNYVEPDWRIAIDTEDQDVDADGVENTVLIPTAYDLQNENNDNKGTVSLLCDAYLRYTYTGSSLETNNMGHILEAIAGDVNNYMLTKYAVALIPHSEFETAYVRISQPPAEFLRGPGYGPQGLGTMYGYLRASRAWNDRGEPYDQYTAEKYQDTEQNPPTPPIPVLTQVRFTVDKTWLGMESLDEFARYLSSGVHLYHDTIHGGCTYDVMGPYRVKSFYDADDPDDEKRQDLYEDTVTGINENGTQLPDWRIIMNSGRYFETGYCNYVSPQDATMEEGTDYEMKRAWIDVPEDWVVSKGGKWTAYLTVRASRHPDPQGNGSQYNISGAIYRGLEEPFNAARNFITFPTVDVDAEKGYEAPKWFAYKCRRFVRDSILFHEIPVEIMSGSKTHPATETQAEPYDEIVEVGTGWIKTKDSGVGSRSVQFEKRNVNRNRVEARSFENKPVGVYTVNEMFEMFNAPTTGNEDAYWQLQTHTNGGFCVKILKNMARFQISKSFADALGLKNSITTIARGHLDDRDQTHSDWILLRVTNPGNPLAHIGTSTFTEMVREDSLDHYGLYNDDTGENEEIDLSKGAAFYVDKIVTHMTEHRYYKVLGRRDVSYRAHRTYKKDEPANLRVIDGIEMYEFENPPVGIIENTSQISVASFALFEGLQVTLPDLPFMPQLTSWSNGERCLLELRFPINYGTGNSGTGQVSATSFEQIGDIIWSAGGAGFEWLPVSSIGDLYQVTANASLIFRDANGRPPRPIYIPQNGIFQIKMAFLEIK